MPTPKKQKENKENYIKSQIRCPDCGEKLFMNVFPTKEIKFKCFNCDVKYSC